MQLKKLIVKGFKSFADKTTITFHKGVTAVVGPNGSGKSNVIEAIQWVMGEQSAKSLRGGRMNDVIFSGTDKRNAMNIAEVTLVLDNSTGFLPIEYEEVWVTRRLSRDGTSDYFINKQHCRLKDIVELFMDSGLGKGSFSIISQGQVEAIFNSKPEERRVIFEEAAGVFKYKHQKEQAEKKMSVTQDNLDRVQDIVYELEQQMKPLKLQSEKAEVYLSKHKELTTLDTYVTITNIEQLKSQLADANSSIDEINHALNDLTTEVDNNQEQQLTLKTELQQANDKRERIQTDILSLVQTVEQLEATVSLNTEKQKHQSAFIASKHDRISDEQQQVKVLEETLSDLTTQKETYDTQISEVQSKLEAQKMQLSYIKSGTGDQLESLNVDYIDLMQQKAVMSNTIQSLETSIATSEAQLKRLSDKQNDTKMTLQTEKDQYTTHQQQLKSVTNSLETLRKRFKIVKEKKHQTQQSVDKQINRVRQLDRDIQQVNARLNSLNEMKDTYSGYFSGVKNVMNNTNHLKDIVGTVADLVHIPSSLVTAIDTALGSSSQFIIVKNEKAGQEAIKYLQNNKAGRATFLPITTIKAKTIGQDVLNNARKSPGYIGVASQLVEFPSHVSTIMSNLLGTTLVAQDLASASKLARLVRYRFRVVSVDGHIINAGGSMTGGSHKSNNSHLFTQKQTIATLNKKLELLTQQLTTEQTTQDELNETLHQLSNQENAIHEQGEQLKQEAQELTKKSELLDQSMHQLSRELKAQHYEYSELSSNQKDQNEQLTKAKEKQQSLLHEIENIKDTIETLKEAKTNADKQQIELVETIDQLKEQLNQYKEQSATIRAKIDALRQQIETHHQTIKQLTDELEQLKSNHLTVSSENLIEDIQTKKSALQNKKEDEQSLKKHIKQSEKRLDTINSILETLHKKSNRLARQKNKHDVMISQLEVKLEYHLNYLSEEYNLDYVDETKQPILDMSYDEAVKYVSQLKKEITQLGHINIQSIDEYQQLLERYQFLDTQQQDLLHAKEQLLDTMNCMDHEVETRFNDMFKAINEQFANVFPKMFGGGKAMLKLTDPNNMLESGVDIIAQPPGKKLVSMSLLSGGERALTAISLLFAIIQVSPIPFCILDEAEAALDEANVARFGRYLKHFETDTQFIVITHRKGTMEEADSLYGITMQEKGISKLVSVRLDTAINMDIEQ